MPSIFLAFGLQPLRSRKWAFSRRLLLTAKKSGVSPLWVVCSHILGLEAEINPSHRLRCRNKLILQKHQGERKGVYHSGLFLRCSYLTALPLYAEEANHPHWLHRMQNGTWLSVPMHLPYLVTRKTKQIHIWHTREPMLLLESTPKLV